MTIVSATIFEAGKAAKATGSSMDENPYHAGSQDSLDWLEGYTDDEAEQNVDEPESDA